MFPKFYYQDSIYIITLFIMSIFKNILVLQNEICFHGNQRAVVLMSCKNTEETVLANDPIHLDFIIAITK